MPEGGIFSVGHSNHSAESFIALLKRRRIDVVIDVRSSPFSRFNPQFNKGRIAGELRKAGVKYAFFGKELGARPEDPSFYVDGRVKYARLSANGEFKKAIGRLLEGALDYRIALMCSEKEPLECHRTILVSQALFEAGQQVEHILADGSIESHEEVLNRLLDVTGVAMPLFETSTDELFAEALLIQESRIAYRSNGTESRSDG